MKKKGIAWLGNRGGRSFLFTGKKINKSETSVRKAQELFNNQTTKHMVLFN